jgi:hypothetical protein
VFVVHESFVHLDAMNPLLFPKKFEQVSKLPRDVDFVLLGMYWSANLFNLPYNYWPKSNYSRDKHTPIRIEILGSKKFEWYKLNKTKPCLAYHICWNNCGSCSMFRKPKSSGKSRNCFATNFTPFMYNLSVYFKCKFCIIVMILWF